MKPFVLLALAWIRPAATQTSRLRANNDVEIQSTRNLQGSFPLIRVANDGIPVSAYPLQKCQGDCDRDSDCASGLKCFYRKMGDTLHIPGCTGSPLRDSTDYCYDPTATFASAPTSPHGPLPVGPTPMAKFPVRPPVKPPVQLPSTAFQPTTTNGAAAVLQDKGINWFPADVYPLKLCQGDCDGDYDCEGELVCHQRTNSLAVPSCTGRPTLNTDYCIHPRDETARPPLPSAFRLKLYWELGYDWQEEFWEQEWCMECDGTSCQEGDEMFLRTCDDDNTWFVYQPVTAAAVNGTVLFQIANTNLCLEWVDARDIRVRTCNATIRRQQFRALNGSFGPGGKFEIVTARGGDDGCLSQHHHPKDGEKIFRANCARFRTYGTSFWIQY
jgi:hypothetical protein